MCIYFNNNFFINKNFDVLKLWDFNVIFNIKEKALS